MNLVSASGAKINHYGQREVVVKTAQSFEGEPTLPKGCKSVAGQNGRDGWSDNGGK